MRIDRFLGMVPKNPPSHLPAGGAQFAQNCFLTDGSQLIPEREPSLLLDKIYSPDGSIFTGEPVTLWKSGDVWVAWDIHVEVCHDYRNYPNRHAFLYVVGGILYRCCDGWILSGTGPKRVGIGRPPVFPEVSIMGDNTAIWSARPKDIVGSHTDCPTNCVDGAQPGEIRSYVFTYVNDMGEESAPSDPSEPLRVPIGSACLVTDPATDVPPNAVARRWYRSLAGDKVGSWRFIRETANAFFADTVDALNLGDELQVTEHWPPPPNLGGVCRLGVNLTLLWDTDNNLFASSPRLPHAYPRQNRMRVHYPIKRSLSDIQQFEGRTSYFEMGSGYNAFILTDGTPYIVVAENGEKHPISVHQFTIDEPLVAPRASTTANGSCMYASPRGIMQLSYGETKSITDELFTHEQWTGMQPHLSHLAFHRGRLFSFGGRRNWYLPISSYIKDRAPLLSFISLSPTATFATPEELTLGLSAGTLVEWDGGTSYMRADWHSGDYQGQEYWNPGAIKVDTVLPFHYTAEAEDAWQDYTNWRKVYGSCARDEEFYKQEPSHRQHRDFIDYMKSPIEVEVYREGQLFCKKIVVTRMPMRLPRQGRGIYWSVRVRTRYPIFRVMLEKSIKDMARDYEPQAREYST